jgi:site-specific recombinase XerD
MAKLVKKGKNWYLNLMVKGRRYRSCLGPDKKYAELAAKEIEIRAHKNQLDFLPKDSDLQTLFQEYLKHSETNNSPATVKRYTAIVDNFKRYLIKLPFVTKISQLNAKIFEDYKAFRKGEGAKPKTINIELQTLKSMFILAVKWGCTNVNPATGVEFIKVARKQEARYLTEEECAKLLDNADNWLRPIFFTFLNTGMRKGELENLTWNDVDLSRRKIKVRAKGSWTPKTEEREIDINDKLLKVLKEQKKKAIGPLVFHDGEGKLIDKNRLRREIIRVAKSAGFPDVTKIHTLRHTFASHLVMKGADLPSVQKLMGHTNIETTMIYSHLAQDHLSGVVSKLNF